MSELYYTPPSDDIFEDIKQAAIKVWSEYDDIYGYANGKIKKIKDILNVQDNAMYMVAMFDQNNQEKLIRLVKPETKQAIIDRIKDGGGNTDYLS